MTVIVIDCLRMQHTAAKAQCWAADNRFAASLLWDWPMQRKGAISKQFVSLLLGLPVVRCRKIRRACDLCAQHRDPSLETLLISGQ